MEMLPALRQRPGPGIGESLPATFLRHADEQTVAALAAVLHAIRDSGATIGDFTDWGVVAAPCFLGRAMLAAALQRLAAEGAWGISPHLIPHRSQHAMSGTISQVLKIFGPNLGAGGGPGSLVEALLAGSVLLDGNQLPGVWVVATEWEPEAIPDTSGQINPEAVCCALALALVGSRPGGRGVRLRVQARTQTTRVGAYPGPIVQKVSQLHTLLTTLAEQETPPATFIWPLEGGGWIEFAKDGCSANGSRPMKSQQAADNGRLEMQQSGAGTESKR